MSSEDALYIHNGRKKEEDISFKRNMDYEKLENRVFVRPVGMRKKFEHVAFNYTIFEHAYFRQCEFVNCSFVGCKFLSSNFSGSKFSGCDFKYAIFERTLIDVDSLIRSVPQEDNLKAAFLRNLRVNFQQQGDVKSVNYVVSEELKAHGNFLKNAAFSGQEYYRKKYNGMNRVRKAQEYLTFSALSLIWGNGESIMRLFLSLVTFLLLMSVFLSSLSATEFSLEGYWSCVKMSPEIFFGIKKIDDSHDGVYTFITIVRLIYFGLFMSVLVKRLSRR